MKKQICIIIIKYQTVYGINIIYKIKIKYLFKLLFFILLFVWQEGVCFSFYKTRMISR